MTVSKSCLLHWQDPLVGDCLGHLSCDCSHRVHRNGKVRMLIHTQNLAYKVKHETNFLKIHSCYDNPQLRCELNLKYTLLFVFLGLFLNSSQASFQNLKNGPTVRDWSMHDFSLKKWAVSVKYTADCKLGCSDSPLVLNCSFI